MSTSTTEAPAAKALGVRVTDDALEVALDDGRALSVPLSWYPRLQNGTPSERARWQFIGGGEGIHWPDLDEDISVAALLAGRGSGESQSSLAKWLNSRRQ
jgi:hypothetical protein